MRSVDYIIVGGGLAGTTLAWHLLESGASILLVDPDRPISASKIAAGLITPVTGRRLVASARFADLWSVAVEFYRRIEARTRREFFRETPMVRLFADDAERARFASRPTAPAGSSIRIERLADGFVMAPAGRLDVGVYVGASREAFAAMGCIDILRETLRLPDDLRLDPECVVMPRFDVRAEVLIFCEGAAGRLNPFLHALDFNPVKGEILTLKIPDLREYRPIHRGVWLAHQRDDLFLAGSTWDWDNLDEIATDVGRDAILAGIRPLFDGSIEVLDNRAAVRPTMRNMRQVIGRLPDAPRLAAFNGLGSRGSLLAPRLAAMLADHLIRDRPIDPDVRFLDRER